MAVVDDNAPPPPELVLGWWCKSYNALPSAGGVMDQEYALMRNMQAAMNTHDVVSRLRASVGEAIHKLPHSDKVLLKYLYDMGLL